MSVCAGLVGLPNVGKSTLFNALTKSTIPAENYPFCTIDPHVACTTVPDKRVSDLQKIYNSEKIIPAAIQFVDIAGLVKGAASGEGLGNQFLSHIREVDLILHVLRCFEDDDIINTSGEIDPAGDYEIIVQELMLKDLESIAKRKEKLGSLVKKHQNNPRELKAIKEEQEFIVEIEAALNSGIAQHVRELVKKYNYKALPLLSSKDFLIIANCSEQEMENEAYKNNKNYQALVEKFGTEKVIPVAARLEGELAQLSDEEAHDMMNMLNIKKRGLDTIIEKTYEELGLITFFTCGPKEIHAWPIPQGITIRESAGEIHSDLEKGFIAADVFNVSDLKDIDNPAKLKDIGKIRTEGQDYITQDGDIINVKFNV